MFFRGVGMGAIRSRVAVIILVALGTRWISFGNPILYSDEEFYFAVGRAIGNGAVPFVDIWDRKPIGLFLIYAIPAALPGTLGIWLYQAMALVSAAATALIIVRLADVAGWARGAMWAGIAYLGWVTIAGGQGGQSPIFYNLAMAMAAWLIMDAAKLSLWRSLAAMFIVGLAIQIKYTVVLEGIFFGLWMMLADWRKGLSKQAILGRAALYAVVALIPTLVVMGYYLSIGEWPAFFFANFQSIFFRQADPNAAWLLNIATLAAILLPLLVMGMASRRRAAGDAAVTGAQGFLTGWLVAALLALALVPPWSDHSSLPVMLPASILAAGCFLRPVGRKIGVALTGLAILIGQMSLVIDRKRLGTPEEFAALVTAVGSGPGCLYVYAASAMLYPATGRCGLSPYVFPSHIARERETGGIGVDQMAELDKIFETGPDLVVLGPAYKGERQDIRQQAMAHLKRDYRLEGRYKLGRKSMGLYRRVVPAGGMGAWIDFD